jgi:creatinine amidohydrolase/Fe(II)-dependent formamide hydrolase-like protein
MSAGIQAVAPSGVMGDPQSATSDHGEAYLDALTDSITRFFRRELEKRSANERLVNTNGERPRVAG